MTLDEVVNISITLSSANVYTSRQLKYMLHFILLAGHHINSDEQAGNRASGLPAVLRHATSPSSNGGDVLAASG